VPRPFRMGWWGRMQSSWRDAKPVLRPSSHTHCKPWVRAARAAPRQAKGTAVGGGGHLGRRSSALPSSFVVRTFSQSQIETVPAPVPVVDVCPQPLSSHNPPHPAHPSSLALLARGQASAPRRNGLNDLEYLLCCLRLCCLRVQTETAQKDVCPPAIYLLTNPPHPAHPRSLSLARPAAPRGGTDSTT
jgi:hypothetical protein